MYLGHLPKLTKGSFALYYGGKEIVPLLSDKAGSMVSPIYMGCSVIFQLSFFIFKKLKFRKFSTGLGSSDMYTSQLASTLMSGFSNTHSLVALVVFSAAGYLFTVVHYAFIERDRENADIGYDRKNESSEPKDLEKIPFTIYFFAIILFLLNLAQYQRNIALRAFAKKRVKEYLKNLVTREKREKHYKNKVSPIKSSLDLSEKKKEIEHIQDMNTLSDLRKTFPAKSLFETNNANDYKQEMKTLSSNNITFVREHSPAKSLFKKKIFIEKQVEGFNEENGQSSCKLTLEEVDGPYTCDLNYYKNKVSPIKEILDFSEKKKEIKQTKNMHNLCSNNITYAENLIKPNDENGESSQKLTLHDIDSSPYKHDQIQEVLHWKKDVKFILEQIMENIENVDIVDDGIDELVGVLKSNGIMPGVGKIDINTVLDFDQLDKIIFTHKTNSHLISKLRKYFYRVYIF